MGLIAIAANPASGRDIRRLVSRASVFNNREKLNIVERIVLAACRMGDHRIAIMPDSSAFGRNVIEDLSHTLKLLPEKRILIPDLWMTDRMKDTVRFAAWAEEQKADVLIVLGGDGTSRAAAKALKNVPLIAVSTGTNNVFPEMVEGTAVGIAAAAIADGVTDAETGIRRCKQIEVLINGTFRDIALVDAVFSNETAVGAKAIWSRDNIQRVVVTRSSPASIGFSALLGGSISVQPEDPFGAVAECTQQEPNVICALSAGVMEAFCMENVRKVPVGERLTYVMAEPGILAFDGERELMWKAGDTVEIVITMEGPRCVDIEEVLNQAQQAGYFRLKKGGEKHGQNG